MTLLDSRRLDTITKKMGELEALTANKVLRDALRKARADLMTARGADAAWIMQRERNRG